MTFPTDKGPDEILAFCNEKLVPFGNDLDLVTRATSLFLAGHYRESMEFSVRVLREPDQVPELLDTVNKETSDIALRSALTRAQYLAEESIGQLDEGIRSSTLQDFREALNSLGE